MFVPNQFYWGKLSLKMLIPGHEKCIFSVLVWLQLELSSNVTLAGQVQFVISVCSDVIEEMYIWLIPTCMGKYFLINLKKTIQWRPNWWRRVMGKFKRKLNSDTGAKGTKCVLWANIRIHLLENGLETMIKVEVKNKLL